ncbi:MAG: hypothetical protein M5U22_20275 [Thermoleophilia bacterium]|nr:hypothetical protein [Thermoleophilia bacterium]
MGQLYVGVDTGGTFTDLVAMDDAGRVFTAKTPTTPGELERGVFDGLRLLATEFGLAFEEFLPTVVRLGYGTTQATNALIERKGAATWLLTTQGLRRHDLHPAPDGLYRGHAEGRPGHVSGQAVPRAHRASRMCV